MKIEKITVRSGRCVPHPLYDFGNLKADLELVASLDNGEDPEEARRTLAAKVESDIEEHVANLKEGIRELDRRSTMQRRIAQLEDEVRLKQKETDELKSIVERIPEMPLFTQSGDAS